MGCVLPAGLGQAPARQAAIKAGLPQVGRGDHGQQDVRIGHAGGDHGAHETIAAGSADIVVAGGMESMTNAPYLLKKHRAGARIGHDTVYDHMFLDGLEDAYEQGRRWAASPRKPRDEYQFTRQADGRLCDRKPAPRQDGDQAEAGSSEEIVPVRSSAARAR